MATGTTTAAPPRNDLHFTKGDMVIVSSNNVKFKVDSLTALAASAVLRDAWGMNQRTSRPAEVTFTDPKIETADIVRTFLELATTGFPTSYISGERAILLVKFLLKYDCERTLHNLASFMAVRCVDFRAAATAFMVAAHTNDPNCRRVSSIECTWALNRLFVEIDGRSFLDLLKGARTCRDGSKQ